MAVRWALALTWIGVVLVLVAPFGGRLLFPSVSSLTPTTTPPPPVEQVALRGVVSDYPAVVNVHQAIQLTLPEDWQAKSANTDELAQMLAQIAQESPALVGAAHQWRSGLSAEAAVTVAMPGNTPWRADQPLLTVFAVERNGLTLERYLEQATFQLKRQGLPILSSEVETTWRADRLPSAVLRYLLPATQGVAYQGMQLVTLDDSAERMIVFTLTTPADAYEALAPVFGQIVQSARF
jgi:hypothetical protein